MVIPTCSCGFWAKSFAVCVCSLSRRLLGSWFECTVSQSEAFCLVPLSLDRNEHTEYTSCVSYSCFVLPAFPPPLIQSSTYYEQRIMRNTHRWSMMQRVNGTSLLLCWRSHWLPSQLPRNCNWYGTNALRQWQQLTGLADDQPSAGYRTAGAKLGYILACPTTTTAAAARYVFISNSAITQLPLHHT